MAPTLERYERRRLINSSSSGIRAACGVVDIPAARHIVGVSVRVYSGTIAHSTAATPRGVHVASGRGDGLSGARLICLCARCLLSAVHGVAEATFDITALAGHLFEEDGTQFVVDEFGEYSSSEIDGGATNDRDPENDVEGSICGDKKHIDSRCRENNEDETPDEVECVHDERTHDLKGVTLLRADVHERDDSKKQEEDGINVATGNNAQNGPDDLQGTSNAEIEGVLLRHWRRRNEHNKWAEKTHLV